LNPNLVYLVQTDTTAGFVSKNRAALARAKGRSPSQPFLICTATFLEQKRHSRTPKAFRKMVRRSRKTTFLYPNGQAIRVVKEGAHHRFLKRFDFLYSTSANRHGAAFDLSYAKSHADVIVEDSSGFSAKEASAILRLGKTKITKLR
jgi:tRNA A37 threonylcarbamoyladenosine synthetase subunit TsaC/SUA5/YrdC